MRGVIRKQTVRFFEGAKADQRFGAGPRAGLIKIFQSQLSCTEVLWAR